MLIKFLKYNLIQLLAYGIELSIFFLILYILQNELLIANVLAKSCAGLFAFYFHKFYTFESNQKGQVKGEIIRYIAVLLANTVLGTSLLLLLANTFHEWVAKIISDVITVGVTFFVTHHLVFGYKKN